MPADPDPASSAPRNAHGGLAPWQIRKVTAHIDQNLASTIRMNDFAAIARLSTSYFARAFKTSFGQTPHAFIVQRRIAHAQTLMLATDDPLCQIAMACGMCDQAHFSKLFRRMIGISPNRWRRQNRALSGNQAMAA